MGANEYGKFGHVFIFTSLKFSFEVQIFSGLHFYTHQVRRIIFHFNFLIMVKLKRVMLKGKFSSGIEGALASTLKSRFQLETTIKNYYLYFSVDVFKVYLSNTDSETAEI